MEENDFVKDLSDLEVLKTIYLELSTPIARRRQPEYFNKCIERLGKYINKQEYE